MKGTDRHFFHDNITNMGEVRACVYFSVIFLCFQISAAKPFFGEWFMCDLFCEDDDGLTTTANSNEDYLDAFCGECPTRRPRPLTSPMPPVFPNPGTPMPPGMLPPPGMPGPPGAQGMGPAPVNYFMMNPPQNGGPQSFSMIPDPNRNGWWSFVWNPSGGPGSASTQPPNATPAPVAPPTTAAAPAAAAPAAAATTAAPAVTTVAPAA